MKVNARPSIQDVARLAGVSLGTVSNVLNNPAMVKPSTSAKVQQAIQQLGFVRNDAARQLKAGKSRTLGMVVYDSSNPFFAEVTRSAENAASERNFTVLVGNSNHKHAREKQYMQLFDQQRVAGVLVSPTSDIYAQIDELRAHGTQTVVIDRKADSSSCCSVSVDDVAGGRIAVEHLLSIGRRNIGFVGNLEMKQVADRLAGSLAALNRLMPESKLVMFESDDMSIVSGRTIGEAVLAMPKSERPDAIFASNDLIAMGLVQAFVLSGKIDIPNEIALIGYDDIPWAEAAVVPLSSIRQPAKKIGETAIALLLDEVENGAAHEHRQVTYQPELVIRSSSAIIR